MSDTRHRFIYTPHHKLHDPQGHPDSVARAEQLRRAAIDFGLTQMSPADEGMEPIEAVHSTALLTLLQTAYPRFAELKEGPRPAIPDSFAVRELGGYIPHNIWGQLGYYCCDDLTPILERTWTAAYWSAQVAVAAAMEIDKGTTLAYALCRPPGHHAYKDLYGGYCYLNNAAIAADVLVSRGHRPAILDIDYHHGNGTQAIFYDRSDVFFCSIHADPEEEYPYYCGFAVETGRGQGEGYTLNLPLPLSTDEVGFLRALTSAVAAIDQFRPTVLLVSVGFDTVAGDPHGGMRLEAGSFAPVGQMIGELGLPLLLVQEGGYLISALGPALNALLEGLVR